MVFAVTISLFPAVISNIKSTAPYPNETVWTSIVKYTYIINMSYNMLGKLFDALVCFLMFNLADCIGRYLSHWFTMVSIR